MSDTGTYTCKCEYDSGSTKQTTASIFVYGKDTSMTRTHICIHAEERSLTVSSFTPQSQLALARQQPSMSSWKASER